MTTEFAGDRPTIFDPSAPGAIESAAEQLADGAVVVFPTDTVYGIGASLSHPDALARIFSLKNRDRAKPLPVLLASSEDVHQISPGVPTDLLTLADRYWPGPLTVVVPAREGMAVEVVGSADDGTPTVGVRVPNHFLAIQLISKAGGAVAVTSANQSGQREAVTAAEAVLLGDEVDIVVDGGRSPGGVPSTVVAVEGDRLKVLREGAIPAEHLQAAWAEIIAGRS